MSCFLWQMADVPDANSRQRGRIFLPAPVLLAQLIALGFARRTCRGAFLFCGGLHRHRRTAGCRARVLKPTEILPAERLALRPPRGARRFALLWRGRVGGQSAILPGKVGLSVGD